MQRRDKPVEGCPGRLNIMQWVAMIQRHVEDVAAGKKELESIPPFSSARICNSMYSLFTCTSLMTAVLTCKRAARPRMTAALLFACPRAYCYSEHLHDVSASIWCHFLLFLLSHV